MIFVKIDFINLLPFNIYLKKNIRSSQLKAIIEYHKSYPSKLNKKLNTRKVHAGFISSLKSRYEKKLDWGIIAKNEVLSVLLIPGPQKEDYQSATSNALSKILDLKGEVIIGDKALDYYYNDPTSPYNDPNSKTIDLAKVWKDKYNLPFVFSVLCYNDYEKYLKKTCKNFNKRQCKIPQYILKDYAKRINVSTEKITHYLKYIDYDIGPKEKKSLKKFLYLTKKRKII